MQAAASGFDRSQPWRRCALWLLVLLSAELCLALTGTQVSKLFDRDGLGNAGAILGGLLHPDLSPEFVGRVLVLSVESLLIGLLGTVMAVLIGVSLAYVAIQVPDLPDPPRRAPTLVRLTDKGFDLIETIMPEHEEAARDILAPLSLDEQKTLNALLARLIGGLCD